MVLRGIMALALASTVLAQAATAIAATAEVGCTGTRGCTFYYVAYRAGPGEANRVTVTDGADFFIRVRDDGARIVPGDGCVGVDDHEVSCRPATSIRAWLGDGDDEYSADRIFAAEVHGGHGDDRLTAWWRLDGGPGDDVVTGGPGSDELLGGGGRDQLVAGGGHDALTDGDSARAPDADRLDGGPGCDLVDYEHRRRPVVVDALRHLPAGERGERDRISDVEGAAGGAGGDRLVGRRCPPGTSAALAGGGGSDILVGTPGPDVISPGPGADRVDARAGDDTLDLSPTRPHAADVVRCGAGSDSVEHIVRSDVASPDCERYPGLGPFHRAWFHGVTRADAPVFGGTADCFGGRNCSVGVRLIARRSRHRGAPPAGTVLGEARLVYRRGPRRIALRLSPAARGALRATGAIPVRVEIRWTRREIGEVDARSGFTTELHAGP